MARAASRYNLLSRCEVFGLTREEADKLVDAMLRVVSGWREFFSAKGVEARSVDMLEQAILPPSFLQDSPPDII